MDLDDYFKAIFDWCLRLFKTDFHILGISFNLLEVFAVGVVVVCVGAIVGTGLNAEH